MKRSEKKEEGDLVWLLNLIGDFPQSDLQSANLRPMRSDQYGQLKQTDELLSQLIYTYDVEKGEFCQKQFILLPNILIMLGDSKSNHLQNYNENAQYLILSNCTITKKVLQYKQSQAFGMILSNSIGNTYLFFQQFIQHRTWYKQLKQYCKLTGFLEMYKLGEKILPGMYTCVKKKNQTQYTVQIYKIDDFELCPELEEAVHNEIHILRSIKHQSLLELKRVYESPKYLFILYEYYKGESLFKLFHNVIQLHEVQVASIVYQILQLVKFLNQHQFYHGSLNPQNILINTQHSMLQITVINLSFKVITIKKKFKKLQEYKVNDKLDWIINRTIEDFLAPEIYEGIAPSVQSDIYAVGCTLYFMSFYEPKQKQMNDDKDFYLIMNEFKVDMNVIVEKEKELSKRYGVNQAQQQSNIVSASQIDLLKKLLEPDACILSFHILKAQRMTIKEATKHHWFVNVKNKIKSMKHERKRKKPLPSLRTIIELREQSEMDIRMTIIQQQQSGINPLSNRKSIKEPQPNQLTQQNMKRSIFQPKNHKQQQVLEVENEVEETDNFDDIDIPDESELNLQVKRFLTKTVDRSPNSKSLKQIDKIQETTVQSNIK